MIASYLDAAPPSLVATGGGGAGSGDAGELIASIHLSNPWFILTQLIVVVLMTKAALSPTNIIFGDEVFVWLMMSFFSIAIFFFFYFRLHYFILFYFILFYFILFYFILFYFILSYFILF